LPPSIKLENVTVGFDGHIALSDISLELTSKSVAIIGTNGSGKSTFARLLNGLVKPTSGNVTVSGKAPDVTNVGFVFSNPDLQIVMPTVYEDVAFSLTNQKLSKDEILVRVEAALEHSRITGIQLLHALKRAETALGNSIGDGSRAETIRCR
jgi:biotin transport system ATP-binding protein